MTINPVRGCARSLSTVTLNPHKNVAADVGGDISPESGVVPTPVNAGGALSLSVSSPEAGPLCVKFPLNCESKIHLSLFGEVITCDLKTLRPDPTVIIQLLKTTQSERANYMVVGASYRRSGLPKSAKAVIDAMIQELGKRGVPESEFKPAYLFLAGCESDLVKLSKATKNSRAASEHHAAAQMWLQKVFGNANATNEKKENKLPNKPRLSQLLTPFSQRDNIGCLKREIQTLRDQNAQQAEQLVRLRSSKRKIEDDYYYERNLRKKYQTRTESVQQ